MVHEKIKPVHFMVIILNYGEGKNSCCGMNFRSVECRARWNPGTPDVRHEFILYGTIWSQYTATDNLRCGKKPENP